LCHRLALRQCRDRRGPDRALFIVDIAVPRDTDPEVAQIPNVSVADIDDLTQVVEVHLERRREAIPAVEEIITEHLERYARWHEARVAVPVVASLVRKAEAIRQSEVARLFARCPELSERERMLVTGASLTIISKLLHTVVTKIRDKATDNRSEALEQARILEELFELRLRGGDSGAVGGAIDVAAADDNAGSHAAHVDLTLE